MDREYELQTHRAEDRHWWYRGRRQVLERVIAGLRLPARARILDAGCGSGRNMVELSRYGNVSAIELSPASVALARERSSGDVVEGSVLEMPFPDSSFDLAASLDVIEHLEDDVAALRELRRVVAPGGRVLAPYRDLAPPVIGTPHVDSGGVVDVAAYDPQSFVVHTTYPTPVLAPAALAYRLYDRAGHPLTALRWALRGTHVYPFSLAWTIYWPGSRGGGWLCFAYHPRCTPNWHYRLAGGLAPRLPSGHYRLATYAWDWAGNTIARDDDVTVH